MKQTRDAQATNFAGYQADWISGFLLRSFKERNVLFRSFFKFLATYETRKKDAIFCLLFL